MYKIISTFLGAVALLSLSAGAQMPDLARMDIVERSVPDGPVALVDNAAVGRGEFLFFYRMQVNALAQEAGGADRLKDHSRVLAGLSSLRELLEREILHQEAARRNLAPKANAVQAAYATRLAGLQEQLAGENEGAKQSEEEILAATGQTKEEALVSVKKSMMVDAARDALLKEKKATITNEEAKKFYDNKSDLFQRSDGLHLQQIFIQPKGAKEEAWAAAEKRVKKALARVRAGESFANVARELSESPDREKGGDLGPIPTEGLPPFYLEAAKDMAENDLSGVIKSDLGFHVIKLLSRVDGETLSFADAKENIVALLRQVKEEDIIGSFCEEAFDAGRVSVFLQLERQLALLEAQGQGN
jgi:foldase protein PrsA